MLSTTQLIFDLAQWNDFIRFFPFFTLVSGALGFIHADATVSLFELCWFSENGNYFSLHEKCVYTLLVIPISREWTNNSTA